MKWSAAGQVLTIWICVAVLASPLIGRYLRNRRIHAEFKTLLDQPAKERTERLRATLSVADSELERRRIAREAVAPITDNQWQANARKAEALGFLDEIDSKRAS